MSPEALEGVSADELENLIREIGVTRFIGRINSGIIDAQEGYEALENYAHKEQQDRPLLSRIAHALLGREDKYSDR